MLAFPRALRNAFHIQRYPLLSHRAYPLSTTSLPVTRASLRFLEPSALFEREKPYHFSGPLEPKEESRRTNLLLHHHDTAIYDLRGSDLEPNLDTHGFQFEKLKSNFEAKFHEERMLHLYMDETVAFIKEKLDAEAVLCFDYRFRKCRTSGKYERENAGGSFGSPNEPAWQVHNDMSQEGGERRIRRHLTSSEAERYLDDSWQIRVINVWRPLYHSVVDAPLAFCDHMSLDASDLIATDRPSREYVGEVYYVKSNDRQRWYWLRDQSPDEVSLFVAYNSKPHLGAACCPHSAFQVNNIPPGSRPRESLELRLIVVTKIDPPLIAYSNNLNPSAPPRTQPWRDFVCMRVGSEARAPTTEAGSIANTDTIRLSSRVVFFDDRVGVTNQTSVTG